MSFIVFILGTIVGSFLNVCIYRIPNGVSISYPPSHCYACDTKLKTLDLIPVLSFVFLRGRCRYCKAKFSVRYPMIEALTGLLFLGVFWKFGLKWETIKYLIFTSYLIVVTFIDFDHMVIVDSTNIVAVVLGLPFLVIGDLRGNFVESLLGILLGAGIIAIIRFISRGGMGDGDIFLMGVVGFYLGYKMLPLQFMLTLVFASVISILLIVFKIKSRKDYIPFGPFIAIGAWVTLIWGNDILNWYTKLLF